MEKYRILCFGDSLTWGFDPEKGNRISGDKRWTGVLQTLLGDRCQVIEEGQNGRTIATEDPAEGEKNGIRYILPCIESQCPLDLMIVMLGTNDLKQKFGYSARDIAGEMQLFLEKVQAYNHALALPVPARFLRNFRVGMSSLRIGTTAIFWMQQKWYRQVRQTGCIWMRRIRHCLELQFMRSLWKNIW